MAADPLWAFAMTEPMLPVLSARKNRSTRFAPLGARVTVLWMVMLAPTAIVAETDEGVMDCACAVLPMVSDATAVAVAVNTFRIRLPCRGSESNWRRRRWHRLATCIPVENAGSKALSHKHLP